MVHEEVENKPAFESLKPSDHLQRSSLTVPEKMKHEGGSKESQKSTHRKLKSNRIEEGDLDLNIAQQLDRSM